MSKNNSKKFIDFLDASNKSSKHDYTYYSLLTNIIQDNYSKNDLDNETLSGKISTKNAPQYINNAFDENNYKFFQYNPTDGSTSFNLSSADFNQLYTKSVYHNPPKNIGQLADEYIDSMRNNLTNDVNSPYYIWQKQHETNISPPAIPKKYLHIDVSINNLTDLISIIDKNECAADTEYNFDLKALHNIKAELILLNDMVGMDSIKKSIIDQLIYFVQDLHVGKEYSPNVQCNECAARSDKQDTTSNTLKCNEKRDCADDCALDSKCKPVINSKTSADECEERKNTGDFKHTVIYGPPGTGKTEVAKIIGKMYSKLGILKKNIFKKVTRNDLIAGYLGQTAIKTKKVIEDCLGGVLFIDEAYSLANSEKNDSFSKECLDILCEALSDHKNDLMVIIAGYEDELNETFFQANTGLKSRFIWRFTMEPYNSKDLMNIFKKKMLEQDWLYETGNAVTDKWFEERKAHFKHFGRDMELLFTFVKISHSRRIYGKDKNMRKKISSADMQQGYDTFLKNIDSKKQPFFMNSIYV